MKTFKLLVIIAIVLLITSCNKHPVPIFGSTDPFVVNEIQHFSNSKFALYRTYNIQAGTDGSSANDYSSFCAPVGLYDIGNTVYVGLPHIVYVHDTIYIKK